MNQNLLTIFVALTAVAVCLQMAILFMLYLSTKKTSARIEALADTVEQKVLPTVDAAHALITETGPKVQAIINNVSESTALVKQQVERLNITMNDVLDRTRLQVIRADEIVTRTMDRVEETTDIVHHVVLSPVRQLAAILTGVMAGVGDLVGNRKVQRARKAVPRDEMFI